MKCKINLMIAVSFIFGLEVGSQPTIQWQRSLGGSALDVAYSAGKTIDKGFVLAGKTLSINGDVTDNMGGNDYWIVKLDSVGIIQWERTFGGENNDRAFSISPTSDHGFIVAGHSESNNGQVFGNHGGVDCWIVKLNSNGLIEWQVCLGGSGWDESTSIVETQDQGFAIAGKTSSLDGDVSGYHGNIDAWVVKLSSTGVIQWQKAIGGSAIDIAYSLKETTDGGFIVVGESESNDGDLSGVHGSTDFMVVKLNHQGDLIWQKMLGSSSLDRANDVFCTSDDGYLLGGQISGADGDVTVHKGGYDIWVVKLNSLGDLQWEKTIGGSGEDVCSSIIQLKDDNFVLVGATQSTNGDAIGNNGGEDLWIIKVDENGSLLWQKTLGGSLSEWGRSVLQTEDSGLLIAGEARSNNGDVSSNQGSSDFWIVKLSPETSTTTTPTAIPLNLYPNPAQNWFRLNLPITEPEMQISITDAQGRVVLAKTIRSDERLNVAALEPGVYGVSALAQSGQVYAGKLVKE